MYKEAAPSKDVWARGVLDYRITDSCFQPTLDEKSCCQSTYVRIMK